MASRTAQVVDGEWVTFPGGELEGRRPRVLCAACRAEIMRAGSDGRVPQRRRTLCFQCYRAELDRDRAIRAAADLDTASVERFQEALPFEPVNAARLARLRVERAAARAELQCGAGRYVDKRRRAQIAARHALQAIASGLAARGVAPDERLRAFDSAVHAAHLQLPESWLPFVVSR